LRYTDPQQKYNSTTGVPLVIILSRPRAQGRGRGRRSSRRGIPGLGAGTNIQEPSETHYWWPLVVIDGGWWGSFIKHVEGGATKTPYLYSHGVSFSFLVAIGAWLGAQVGRDVRLIKLQVGCDVLQQNKHWQQESQPSMCCTCLWKMITERGGA
jgi:hypothetical protein